MTVSREFLKSSTSINYEWRDGQTNYKGKAFLQLTSSIRTNMRPTNVKMEEFS